MIERLKQFVREYIYGPPTREPDTDPTLFERLQTEGCVVCDDNPDFRVHGGPGGGMSQNVWCFYCGTRYNIAMFPSPAGKTHGIAEIVHEREREEEFRKQRDES